MNFVRVLAKVLFSAAAFLLLIFSVCVLVFSAYSFYAYAVGGKIAMPAHELALAPFLGVTVFTSALYILMGRHRWHALFSAGALLLTIGVCLLLFLAGIFKLNTPWPGDEIAMSLGVGGYCSLLLMGVVLRYRGFWDQVVKVPPTTI